jgi:1-phosphatidylinositol-4-phosphate 5-kinase
MQQQLEQIQRERLSKRVKQAEETPQVLVGNLISEGHVKYVLMYNMLTGIRTALSRTQAKIKRTDEDYTAHHKYTFDM